MGRPFFWFGWLLAGLLWCGSVRAAEALAVLTIVEGEVVLLRDGAKFTAGEGVRLAAADILETTAQARLARIEFADGVIADLGPGTRALLAPRVSVAKRKPPRLYLLQGWLKLTVPTATPAGGPGVLAPPLEFNEVTGQLVIASLPTGAMAFSEAGGAALQGRVAAVPANGLRLKAGEFFVQAGADKPEVKPRPTPAFIQAVPRPFLDPLPARAALFKSRDVAPKRVGDMAYADAAAWLGAEPLLRGYFVTQWRALARRADSAPAWPRTCVPTPSGDRTVFPEKYLPKPAAPSAAPAAPYK